MSRSLKALQRIEEQMAVTFKHYKQDVSYIRDDLIKLKLVKEKLSSLCLEKSDDKCYLSTKSKERYLSSSYKTEIPEELYLFFVYLKEVLDNE